MSTEPRDHLVPPTSEVLRYTDRVQEDAALVQKYDSPAVVSAVVKEKSGLYTQDKCNK